MSRWKNYFVVFTMTLLCASLIIFLITGYTALYWAWIRGNLPAALPFLPWARNFGMLAIASASIALAVLFSPKLFPVPPRTRLSLSLFATLTIASFAEFRNEGKFHFRGLVHFFGPGTSIHDALNRTVTALGDVLYRFEYAHWNDFLMGPAIVSVLFTLVFIKVGGAFRNQGSISLSASLSDESEELDHALRFARILMNVGLFWFFIQAWAEKAGYLRNPHSSDEIDLPFEFAGTMLGFWMARVLTRPFGKQSEDFRSNFLVDFLSSGAIGLLYTLIVGPLTEGVASSVGHSLYRNVPGSLDGHEYTLLQRHMRPLELLVLAAAMWWGLNRFTKQEELTQLTIDTESIEVNPGRAAVFTIAKVLGVLAAYLIVLTMMLSLLEPEGFVWTMVTTVVAVGAATAALLLVQRASRQGFMTVFKAD